MTSAAPAQLAKLDPETLAIRSRPPRAIRCKRGVIIVIAAIGSVSLIAVLRGDLAAMLSYSTDKKKPDPFRESG